MVLFSLKLGQVLAVLHRTELNCCLYSQALTTITKLSTLWFSTGAARL